LLLRATERKPAAS